MKNFLRKIVNFILTVIATAMTILGILFIAGILNISSERSEHNKTTYTVVDGVLVDAKSKDWSELETLQGSVNLNININESTNLWTK